MISRNIVTPITDLLDVDCRASCRKGAGKGQEGEFERVGEEHSRRVGVRLIAATNRDLRREIADGWFRCVRLYVYPSY